MLALNLSPAFSFFSRMTAPPFRPLHVLMRAAEDQALPTVAKPHQPRRAPVSNLTPAGPGRASILREAGHGRVPTIVLGGFVPDSSEQVFLLRRFLLRSGDVYYVNYPRDSFSLPEIRAQLDNLVAELASAGQAPVILSVSFGAGIVMDWLRSARLANREISVAGLVMVSPVACLADLIAPGAAKPTTLIGRALASYLDTASTLSESTVERSRTLFLRMFQAGAGNKDGLRRVMTAQEGARLQEAVMSTIRGISPDGARQRVQALAAMAAPTDYFSPAILPLTQAPVLALFAQSEDGVLLPSAPVRFVLDGAAHAYFPQGVVRQVTSTPGAQPVQHASLVFHVFEFLPPLQAFYQRLRRRPLPLAA